MIDSAERKIALVTGASRQVGIGSAIARALAEADFDVFITYFRPYDDLTGLAGDSNEPENLLAALRETGVRADGLEVDLSQPDAPEKLFKHIEATFGTVSVLVNNATHSLRDGIENLSAEILDKHYAVNLRGMALLCKEFTVRFRANAQLQDGGRIINMSSGQGVGPMPGELAYVATKGAVEAFTLTLSAEVAGDGITVNAIDPGITDTGWISAELHKQWQAESPMGRVGMPRDVAKLVSFLASEQSAWITGQVIHSRGGL